jgi:hypothetical protein
MYEPFPCTNPQSIRRNRPSFLLCVQPTNCMEQSCWEADVFSASQGISRNSQNPKVNKHIKKNVPLVPPLSQMNWCHALTSFLSRVNLLLLCHLHLYQDKEENIHNHTQHLLYHYIHVSTHYPGHHQVAAHLEVGMFTTVKARRIILYNTNEIHILLYTCVCL